MPRNNSLSYENYFIETYEGNNEVSLQLKEVDVSITTMPLKVSWSKISEVDMKCLSDFYFSKFFFEEKKVEYIQEEMEL